MTFLILFTSLKSCYDRHLRPQWSGDCLYSFVKLICCSKVCHRYHNVVTQEIEENDTLDSEIVKKIASCDVIERVREFYGRKTTQIFPFCKLVVCSNKIPKYDMTDKTMNERIVLNPFMARFLNEDGIKLEKLRGTYDETKFKYYPSDNVLAKKYAVDGRNIDILFSWLVYGCMEFYAKYNEGCGVPKPKIVREYIVTTWITENCDVINIDEWIHMSKKPKKISNITFPIVCKF